jgi:hypothetical protein
VRIFRIAFLFLLSFAAGGGMAELALRAKQEVARVRQDVQPGSTGDLVALLIKDADGATVATPRLITSPGRPARLVLRDPAHPSRVRLELRVSAVREPAGFYSLEYALDIPGERLLCAGQLDLTPGVEQTLDLGDGTQLSAVVVALPVPSAAFDAWLEAERGRDPAFRPTGV